jgi:hypothetical protein
VSAKAAEQVDALWFVVGRFAQAVSCTCNTLQPIEGTALQQSCALVLCLTSKVTFLALRVSSTRVSLSK